MGTMPVINGAAVKAIRERTGYTQGDLARLSGVSQGHISGIESGAKQATVRTMRRLADALAVTMDAIALSAPVS